MVAYQYQIRKQKEISEVLDFDKNLIDLKKSEIRLINKTTASKIILEYEWLHSMPFSNKYFFGIYFKINNIEYLGGVLVFGNEYTENTGVWDKYDYTGKILLLSRGVCLWWTPKNTASYFISRACDWIKKNTHYRIITATVDRAAGEIGTIYQSLNWNYVGLMSGNYHGNKVATRFGVIIDGKLRFSRWIRKKIGTMKKEKILEVYPNAIFVPQYRKERYFYFIGNRREKKYHLNKIKHILLSYPKRDNQISGIIYQIKNKTNNKIYIGQTIRSFRDRIHEYELGLGNDYLNNSFKKYGFDNFEFKIIDTVNTLEELNQKEIYYINKYKTTDRNFGYNIENGGKNTIPSIETKEKMSLSHKGIKQSEDWKNKRISKAGTEEAKKYGRTKTEEEKINISLNSPKFWLGKKRDQKTKIKISKTKKTNGLSEKQKEKICKKVYKIDISNNQIIKTYISTKHASESEGVNQSTISRWCKNNRIISGYLWSYSLQFTD